MSDLKNMGMIVETDVLVIGGGVAGLWSSIKAREFVNRVTIVDKGPKDWGGQASLSGGGMVGVIPEDSVQKSLEDFVYYYDGLCDQELMEMILANSYKRMQDLERLGYEFICDEQGRLKGVPQRALDHVKCYIGQPFGKGGKSMVGVLVKEADRLGVQRLGRIVVTDILKHQDSVCGAVGFNSRNGQFYIFKARAVILAVGNVGWKISYGHNTCAGDSVDIGLRAGAEISNCEFARLWLVPRYFSWEGQTYLLPLGARLVNAKGESFMDKYSPVFGGNTDPIFIARALCIETLKGNAPFYMDCSGMSAESVEMMTPKGRDWMEINYLKLRDMGMDLFRDKTEWMIHLRWTVMGIHADLEGRTRVPGLFVCGRARSTDPTPYSGGLSLCLCAVTGNRTGEAAGKFADSQKQLPIDSAGVKSLKDRLSAHLSREGITPVEVLREVREAVFPYYVCALKTKRNLQKALAKIQEIRAELIPRMAARDPHYLMKLIEVGGIALFTELFLRASLMRTESRAGHFREDYPDRDNDNWLSWLIVGQRKDEIAFRTEPLPIARYKIKPTRYYTDNFRFPRVEHLLP